MPDPIAHGGFGEGDAETDEPYGKRGAVSLLHSEANICGLPTLLGDVPDGD